MDYVNEQELLEDDYFRLTFKDGEFEGRTFLGAVFVSCWDVTCTCGTIGIKYHEDVSPDADGSMVSVQPLYQIVIDAKERELVLPAPEERENDPELFRFAEACLADFTDQDWSLFAFYENLFKVSLMESATDLSTYEIDFSDPDSMDGEFISYTEIFPYAERIYADVDGENYWLEDRYHLYNSHPYCYIAMVEMPFQEDNVPILMLYNYKTGEWGVAKEGDIKPPTGLAAEAISYLAAEYPEYRDMLKKRHRTLEKLYDAYQKRTARTAAPLKPKTPGRNDPCPCGSGKKYKRCCGR